MQLAIASPSYSIYSETFIAEQFRSLPWNMRIHGHPIADETEPGGNIHPFRSIRNIIDAASFVIFKNHELNNKQGRELLLQFKARQQERELIRRFKKNNIKICLANFGTMGANLLTSCEKANVKLVTHFHGMDAHAKQTLDAYQERYQRLSQSSSSHFIAVSHGMIKSLHNMGIPQERIHLIRYGVDPKKFPKKHFFPDTPHFLAVGRFVDKKAPYLTLLAFSEVVKQFPKAKLTFAGDGDLLETTTNLAQALNISENVNFPGVLSSTQVSSYMQEATAYIQHSLEPHHGPSQGDREGTPVTILEAMMVGLPVVSTFHAGIQEVVDHETNGFLVPERNVSSMAKYMIQLAKSPPLCETLGNNAHHKAIQKFTLQNYIQNIQKILQVAIHDNNNSK